MTPVNLVLEIRDFIDGGTGEEYSSFSAVLYTFNN